jgi:hypothetical protein
MDMPPSRNGISVHQNEDGSWFLTVSITAATFARLRGTKALADFFVNFVALFQEEPPSEKGN